LISVQQGLKYTDASPTFHTDTPQTSVLSPS